MSTQTILPWFANELASLDPSSFAGVIEQTSGANVHYDPAYCRCCIYIAPGYSALSPTWASAANFWFHFRLNGGAAGGGGGGTNCRQLSFLSSGVEVLRLVSTGVSAGLTAWEIFTLQGGVLTQVGSQFQIPLPTSPYQFAIRLVAGPSGIVEFYSSGTFQSSISATGLNHGDFSGVDQVQPTGTGVPFNGADCFWSEMIADTVPHMQGRVKTYPIDTLSSVNNQWVGTVGNVDKIVSDDSTFVSTVNALQDNSYYANGFSLGSLPIYAIGVHARAKCDPTGPQNLRLLLRTSALNYLSASTIALNAGYQACCWNWTLNPSNNASWTDAIAQAVEGGHESEV